MELKKILIAGVGQLGSRYLQGLSSYPEPLDIWLQDPSPYSIQTATDRWKESSSKNCQHRLNIAVSGKALPKEFDIAIVSTNANIRPAVVSEIDRKYQVQRWILEKVLAQSEEGVDIIVNTIGDRPAWVNTPMHLWSLYANLSDALPKGKPIRAEIKNFEGLACSSIHFIDYIARCNASKVMEIDSAGLDRSWVEAKRPGFMEVNGVLDVKFSDGSNLKLFGNRDAPYYYLANLFCDGESWEVDGRSGTATADTGRKVTGRSEFQSELTAGILKSIFSEGVCSLPELSESADQHRVLLKALIKHWNAWRGTSDKHVPIT